MDIKRKNDVASWAHSKIPGFENFTAFVRFLTEKRFIILFALAAIVLLFFFWSYIKMLVVMAIFIVLAAMSMLYNRWIKVSLALSL